MIKVDDLSAEARALYELLNIREYLYDNLADDDLDDNLLEAIATLADALGIDVDELSKIEE